MQPKKRTFTKDERADDSLPLRFTITAILILLIMGLAITAIADLKEKANEDIALIEIGKLISNSEQIYFRGEGSTIYIDIEIPDDVTMHMGTLPDNTPWPSNANNYYIQTRSRYKTYKSKALFSNFAMDGPYTINSGPHSLKLENQKDNMTGKIFVKISET
ncbi:MAG: hypothetical protein K8R13_11455 [Methanococcoides sp.]|nr:hypothetical protein [Methanococcoides sp.]